MKCFAERRKKKSGGTKRRYSVIFRPMDLLFGKVDSSNASGYLASFSYCFWMESTNCCGVMVPSSSDWNPGMMALACMPAVALLM